MNRARFLLAALLLGGALFAIACGGSGGAKATPTQSPSPTAAPTATASAAAAPGPTLTAAQILGAPPPTGISNLTFLDPQHGWAIDSCPENKGNQLTWCSIMSTDDGGLTWRVQHRDLHGGQLRFLDLKNGFVIGPAESILVTSDGGNEWTQRYATAPHDLSDITFATPEVAFAAASGVIFQLDLPLAIGLTVEERLAVDIRSAWVFNYGTADCRFSSISVSQSDRIWAGGQGPGGPCLYRTNNLGKSWTASFSGTASPSVTGALGKSRFFPTQSPATPELVIPNCSSGAPTFFGETEARLSIFCAMGSGITLTSADGGKTWQYASEHGSCLMGCMTQNYQTGSGGPTFYLDNMHAWQRTAHQVVSWSVDGGVTWTRVDSPALCCDAGSIFFVDADHGWVTVGGEIARTTDGGRTWTRLPVVIQ